MTDAAVAVLDRRSLNRATLARQHLLERTQDDPRVVVGELLGLQAQNPWSPHVALWSRVRDYDPAVVDAGLASRELVRLASMRNTIHLMTADDALELRAFCQVVADRQFRSTQFAKDVAGLDRAAVVAAARALVEREPMPNAKLGAALQEQWPDVVRGSLAQLARHDLAFVQVPPRGQWGAAMAPTSTTVEAWLGRGLPEEVDVPGIVRRFLATYGPASVRDVQAWCGVTRLKAVVDELRPELVTFRDEAGVELFDLPDAPRPSADAPVPPRFLPDYENAIISLADRSRFQMGSIFGADVGFGGLDGTILLDGVVAGMWRVDRDGRPGVLVVRTHDRLTGDALRELRVEAEAFAAFLATAYDVRGIAIERNS